MNDVDLSTLIGVILGIVLCVFGMVVGQENAMQAISSFLHLPSALITFGGAMAATLTMSPSIKDFVNGLKSFGIALKKVEYDEIEKIKQIIDLSNVARKEGLLALEEAANSNIEDESMKKGILLIVDGTDPEFVRRILETELECIEGRHKSTITFWENLASMGPAWGMIGTLVGLVLMLADLQDINSVGPNMAVALITTFYGSFLANVVFAPLEAALKNAHAAEMLCMQIVVEGVMSIASGSNPRLIQEKLEFMLPKTAKSSGTADAE